jgi:hypothetical protein
MPRKIGANPKIWALVSMACPVLLALVLIGVAPFVPNYDPVKGLVSKLSLGSSGWLGMIIFASLAFTIAAFGRGLSCSVAEPIRFKLPVRLIYTASACFILLMFIKIESERGVWTLERVVHWAVVGAACACFSLACLLMLAPLKHDQNWRGMYKYTIIMLASVIAISWVILLTVWHWPMSGLYERVIGAIVLIWVEVMSFRMLRVARSP